MPITSEDQARTLAHAIHLLRPSWSEESFYRVMLKEHEAGNPLLQREFADILIAATQKAMDPQALTPKVVWFDGKHWPPRVGVPKGPAAPRCEDHETESAHNCPSCFADYRAGDRPQELIGKRLHPAGETTTRPTVLRRLGAVGGMP